MSIEKQLFKEKTPDVLKGNAEDGFTATIIDQELDPIECSFVYDGGVVLQTDKVDYVCLSANNVQTLARLIKQAEREYER